MGACCSMEIRIGRPIDNNNNIEKREYDEEDDDDEHDHMEGDCRIRLRGSSRYTSMFTQKGRKRVNQDAMTVWEDFTGEKDMFFCGVFDGHGPYGHKVARHVRDSLPLKLFTKLSELVPGRNNTNVHGDDSTKWETMLIKSFKEIDHQLSLNSMVDSFCSGTTAVTVIKQGKHLIISNLGDSRAVLCTRDANTNQLIPVQLTVDLKPNIPSELERIKNCNGRVFAMKEEPDVYRVWMPEEDCPGLAMARAFGDFCLKDYGLISTPQVYYRKITKQDEFVVLATDGVWDVLTNTEVIHIIASTRKRSMAAKMLVNHAVQAWQYKYPMSKIDDCAVICLFLKPPTPYSRTVSEVSSCNLGTKDVAAAARRIRTFRVGETNYEIAKCQSELEAEEHSALEGVSRVNSIVKLP